MYFLSSVRLQSLSAILILSFFSGQLFAQEAKRAVESRKPAEAPAIEVYRTPGCGCCGKWLEHLENNQFKVTEHRVDDLKSLKARYGVPSELASCHTAIVNGYVVEGHVPAADIKKLLANKPEITGIAVPGMPVGTPGMEMDGRKDTYQVLSFDHKNPPQVFSEYAAE